MPKPAHSSPFPVDDSIERLNLQGACSSVNLLLLMLVVELIAIVLSVPMAARHPFLGSLAMVSSCYQLSLMLSLGLICQLQAPLGRLGLAPVTLAICALASASALLATLALRPWLEQYTDSYPLFLGQTQLVSIGLCLFFLRHHYLMQLRYQQLRAQLGAHLESLRAYIRPHFLFNSLNNLASVVRVDPAKAEELVLALAYMLRYAMRPEPLVGLRDELDFLRHYAFVEQMRLGERLRLEWRVGDAMDNSVQLPAMIIQPLLENAINHGPGALVDGGQVVFNLQCNAHALRLHIHNEAPLATDGAAKAPRLSTSTIRDRLMLLYDGRARLSVRIGRRSGADKQWWHCRLALPTEVSGPLDSSWSESGAPGDADKGGADGR